MNESDWISERFTEWTRKREEQAKRAMLDRELPGEATRLFNALKDEIEKDVRAYNHIFRDFPGCQCRTTPFPGNDGIMVSRADNSRTLILHRVDRSDDMILYRVEKPRSANSSPTKPTEISVKPNYQTEAFQFVSGNDVFAEPGPLARHLLDKIFCGLSDYDFD